MSETPQGVVPRGGRKRIPATVREAVWIKWIGDHVITQCFCCERARITAFCNTEFGHIIAVANGGTDNVDNLRPICAQCNREMGTENMETYRARLKARGIGGHSERGIAEAARDGATVGVAVARVTSIADARKKKRVHHLHCDLQCR